MKATIRYRPALDGLRAVAVLGIIAYHVGVPGTRGGWLGVDLFFVLSGFLHPAPCCCASGSPTRPFRSAPSGRPGHAGCCRRWC